VLSFFRVFVVLSHKDLNSFAAVGAVFKIAIDFFATIPARPGTFRLLLVEFRSIPGNGLLAAIAHDKGLPLFDSEYWNKKQAEVVVGALVIRLMQAAHRASARILI
jgi:hypothetical protein